MAELKITAANFENELLRSDKPVLLDFYADWCAPCRMLSPVLHELAEENSSTLKVGKINVDEQTELAARFQVGWKGLCQIGRLSVKGRDRCNDGGCKMKVVIVGGVAGCGYGKLCSCRNACAWHNAAGCPYRGGISARPSGRLPQYSAGRPA